MRLNKYLKDAKWYEQEIFIELCRRIGKETKQIKLKKLGNRWEFPFKKHTWTEEEEEAYRK